MSRPLYAHIAAIRHQIQRIQRTTVLGTAAMLPCAVLLLATAQTMWLVLLLVVPLLGYTHRKVRRMFWMRRTVRQLRLEEQFVRHSPTPESVLTCTRRYNHLWAQCLTLKSLKALSLDKNVPSSADDTRQAHICAYYIQALKSINPTRLPTDLIWFAALGLLWLWFVPATLLLDRPILVVGGMALLLVILTAEIIQAILNADLRDSIKHLATLLSAWTLSHAFDTAFDAVHKKPYRHTALYRSWIFSPKPTLPEESDAPPAPPLLSPLHVEVDELLLQTTEESTALQNNAPVG